MEFFGILLLSFLLFHLHKGGKSLFNISELFLALADPLHFSSNLTLDPCAVGILLQDCFIQRTLPASPDGSSDYSSFLGWYSWRIYRRCVCITLFPQALFSVSLEKLHELGRWGGMEILEKIVLKFLFPSVMRRQVSLQLFRIHFGIGRSSLH